MNSDTVQSQIRQLEALKAQRRFWSGGYTLALFLIALFSILSLRGAITGLASDGDTQKQFVQNLSTRLNANALPSVQELATQTLHDIDFGAEAQKLNKRTPELTQATLNEIKILGDELPKQGQQILNDTFVNGLKGRESKIRSMYPDVNEDQLKKGMETLASQAQTQAGDISMELFGEHQASLNNIMHDIAQIQASEPGAKGETPSWEMGMTIFDIARADLKDAAPAPDAEKSKTAAKKESQK